MKFVFVLFALIGAAVAAPQFGISGSAANAQASSQTFNQGGHGHYPHGGISGSAAHAGASSSTFTQGAHYPVHGGGHYPVHQQGHYPVHGGHGVHG